MKVVFSTQAHSFFFLAEAQSIAWFRAVHIVLLGLAIGHMLFTGSGN